MKEEKHYHYNIHKPFGVLSHFSSKDPKEVRQDRFLSKLGDFPKGTMPIGRLDKKSEGLLLLTTDGKVSDHINRSGIEKEYYSQLDGEITSSAIYELCAGVKIGIQGKEYLTKPCLAKIIDAPTFLTAPDASLRVGKHRPSSWVSITLTEGKFRQVRKMTAAVGFPTLRLVRVRIGTVTITGLPEGKWEALQPRSLPQ